MTESTVQTETLVQPASVAAPPARVAPRPPLYGKRFALAYALLAVLLGAAAGLAVVLLEDAANRTAGAPWSEWAPSAVGTTPRMKEISDFVERRYRLDSGRQLVGVDAAVLAVQAQDQSVSVTGIATSTGSAPGDEIQFEQAGNAWMFNMCGLGERCSISEGDASAERHRLLRRQALELALYTFQYVEAVDSVVAFLPPSADAQQSPQLVYLRRGDLEQQLKAPLAESLLPLDRLTPADVPPTEADLIDALTQPRLYTFDFQQGATGGAVMVLAPAV